MESSLRWNIKKWSTIKRQYYHGTHFLWSAIAHQMIHCITHFLTLAPGLTKPDQAWPGYTHQFTHKELPVAIKGILCKDGWKIVKAVLGAGFDQWCTIIPAVKGGVRLVPGVSSYWLRTRELWGWGPICCSGKRNIKHDCTRLSATATQTSHALWREPKAIETFLCICNALFTFWW